MVTLRRMLALATLMVGLAFFRGSIRRLHEFLGRLLPQRFRESWMHFFDTFTETLELTKHRRALVTVLLCTAGVWACLTSQFWFATLAAHKPLPFDSSFFVTGVTTARSDRFIFALSLGGPRPGRRAR